MGPFAAHVLRDLAWKRALRFLAQSRLAIRATATSAAPSMRATMIAMMQWGSPPERTCMRRPLALIPCDWRCLNRACRVTETIVEFVSVISTPQYRAARPSDKFVIRPESGALITT